MFLGLLFGVNVANNNEDFLKPIKISNIVNNK